MYVPRSRMAADRKACSRLSAAAAAASAGSADPGAVRSAASQRMEGALKWPIMTAPVEAVTKGEAKMSADLSAQSAPSGRMRGPSYARMAATAMVLFHSCGTYLYGDASSPLCRHGGQRGAAE